MCPLWLTANGDERPNYEEDLARRVGWKARVCECLRARKHVLRGALLLIQQMQAYNYYRIDHVTKSSKAKFSHVTKWRAESHQQ